MEIFVEALEFVGLHGVYEEERRDGRRFSVDLVVDVGDREEQSDDIDTTVDYCDLARLIHHHGVETSVRLIETLGDNILDDLFDKFSCVETARLTIRKYATGVPGDPRWVGVVLERNR